MYRNVKIWLFKSYKAASCLGLAILLITVFMLTIISYGSNGSSGSGDTLQSTPRVLNEQSRYSYHPEILEFFADPPIICPEEESILKWNSRNIMSKDRLYLDNGTCRKKVDPDDHEQICLDKTTTYVLEVWRQGSRSNIFIGSRSNVTVEVSPENSRLCIKSIEHEISYDGRGLDSDFDIANVADGDTVAQAITLIGNYPRYLEDDIWLFVVSPDGYYYPQSVNPSNDTWRAPKNNGKWEMWAGLGTFDEVDEFFDIVLTVADSSSSQYISNSLKDWYESNYYPGWRRLPSGVTEVERITVIRGADRWGPAPEISNADIPGEFSFSNIADGDRVPWRINIVGNSSSDLESDLWVLVYAPNGRWYPQSVDPCNGDHVRKYGWMWEVPGYFGGDGNIGEAFDVVAVLADETASEFFDAKQREWCNAGDFTGFLTIELPPGVDEKDRVRVYRSSDRWGPAPEVSNCEIQGDASFTNIKDGYWVPRLMNLDGNCSSDLKGDIWILVYAPNDRWYPQSTDACNGSHVQKSGHGWRVPGIFEGELGNAFDVVVVLANVTASGFFDAKQREWCKAGDYPGFLTIELPPGVDEKDRVRVYRSSDRWGPAPEISNADIPGDVSLTNIVDGGSVPWRMNLLGNSSSDLEGDVWVLVYTTGGRWYPQSTDACNGCHTHSSGQKWEVPAYFGGEYSNIGEAFDVVVLLANGTASDFFDAKQREWCKACDYPGFSTNELPMGIDEKDRARVYRSADRWGPAPEISNADIPGDVSLTNVADDDRVPSQMKINGNCSSDIKGDLWVLVYAPNGRWYPQSTNPCGGVHVQRAGQRWRVSGSFGGDGNVGEAFDVVVVLANDTASGIFDAKQREGCNAGDYPGLLTVELPPGIDVKDRARVIRR